MTGFDELLAAGADLAITGCSLRAGIPAGSCYPRLLAGMLAPDEVKRVMEITTSWHLKGRQEGRQELLLRMLKKRLGYLSPELEMMIAGLSVEQLDQLAESLVDITSEADLKRLLDGGH